MAQDDDRFDLDRSRCTYFDMLQSNNSARIRIWLRLKGLEDAVKIVLITAHELHAGVLKDVNPLKKVPAFVTDSGLCLFESYVILQYLEDRFGATNPPSLLLDTPDDRAFVQLLVRVHDIYISSPNASQPHFSHTQGCLYLDEVPTNFTPEWRTMDIETRAAKVAELYKQLSWLEDHIRLPYLAGERITHADCTWFPTSVFFELLLPYVYSWSPVFHETEHFPKLTQWFAKCHENEHFKKTYQEINGVLRDEQRRRRFDKVKDMPARYPEYKWKYI